MLFPDLLRETTMALTANRMRSGLTMLGIVIGIASVIAMLAIGSGAQAAIQSSIEGLGSNLLTVLPGAIQPGRGLISSGRGQAQSLKLEDAEALWALPGVVAVSPELSRRFQIVSPLGNNTNSTVIGAASSYAVVRNVTIKSGAFFSDIQDRGLARVAVLGPTVAADLFGDSDPIGQFIRVGQVAFTVVGVFGSKGGSGFFTIDDAILVPLRTAQKILAGVDFVTAIAISVDSRERMSALQEEATILLSTRHRVADPDFSIISQADILGTMNQVTQTFTLFLASIAGISLLVGGIGIMNMMLTTVTERTREIGLRRALGATRADISSQFLAEAMLLTLLGGAIGIAFGWSISFGVSRFANIATRVSGNSVALAVGIAAATGLLFGFYPARRAANLNPIEALRYE